MVDQTQPPLPKFAGNQAPTAPFAPGAADALSTFLTRPFTGMPPAATAPPPALPGPAISQPATSVYDNVDRTGLAKQLAGQSYQLSVLDKAGPGGSIVGPGGTPVAGPGVVQPSPSTAGIAQAPPVTPQQIAANKNVDIIGGRKQGAMTNDQAKIIASLYAQPRATQAERAQASLMDSFEAEHQAQIRLALNPNDEVAQRQLAVLQSGDHAKTREALKLIGGLLPASAMYAPIGGGMH